MKKIAKTLLKALLGSSLILGTLYFSSCSQLNNEIVSESEAYITLSTSCSRTIFPEFDTENFSSFVLKGKFNEGEEQLIGNWDTLNSANAKINAGKWDFTLTCKNGSASLEGKLTGKSIVAGNNLLNFDMKVTSYGSSSSYGKVSVSVNVPENVRCVKAGLFDVETGRAISDYKAETLEISSRTATYQKSIVSTGTYTIKFFMYGDVEGTVLLNTYSEVVVIASEAVSSGSETISSVNSAFSIDYDLGKGEIKSGYKLPGLYSILNTILLPSADDLVYQDHIFAGWYETSDFSDSPVTEISAGTSTGNKKYYARWVVQGNYTLDVTDVATKIGNLEADGAYTIKATGACSEDDITKIKNSLSVRSDVIVYLDLSSTTGLTQLSANAFQNSTALYGVVLPASIKSMGSGVFAGCSNLTSITIPFVGSSATATTSASTTLFGYIFGTTSFKGATATAQCYSSSTTTYYIPDSLRSVTVLGGNILYGAFSECSKLTDIVVPATLTQMGDKVFYNCANLKQFEIPSGLTLIGSYEFQGCSSITEIQIPKNVVTINTYAFAKMAGLLSCTFEEGSELTTIYSSAFSECSVLESLDFSVTKLKTISSYSFSKCSSLASVNLSSGALTTIGTYSFQNCSSLTNIVVPQTVTSIGSCAFTGCAGLTSMTLPFIGSSPANVSYRSSTILFGYIFGTPSYSGGTACSQSYYSSSNSSTSTSTTNYIPSGLTSIIITGPADDSGVAVQTYALSGISVITNITYKGGKIEDHAFFGMKELKTFTFDTPVNTLDSYAFGSCPALTSVSVKLVPGGKIGSYAFSECKLLKNVNIPDGTTEILSYAFSNCTSLPEIEIPDTVTKIESNAFKNCFSLSSIVIPDSVTAMGSGVFFGCSGLTEMTIPFTGSSAAATVASYTTDFGYIFGTSSYTGSTAANQYYSGTNTYLYYIPTALTKVTLTGTKLWYGAFSACSKIETINIPSTITAIPDYCFTNCSSLKQAPVPSVVTSIGNYAFMGCSALTAIPVPDGVTILSTGVFQGCSGLTSFTIPAQITEIKANAFYECTGLESLTISEAVTKIGTNAFYNCSSLESLTIPGNVTAIDNYAFTGCKSLESVTIPDSVVSIGSGIFNSCINLKEISIPFVGSSKTATTASSTTLFGYIFGTTPNTGSKGINQYYSSSNYSSYYIPESLTTVYVRGGNIYYGAFYNCTTISLVDVDSSVTSIGTSAFYKVPAVHYHGTLESSNNWGAVSINTKTYEIITPSNCITHGVGNVVCSFCGYAFEENVELDYGCHTYEEDLTCTICGEVASDPVWVMTSTSSYPWKQSDTMWLSSNGAVQSSSSSSTWDIELAKEISYTISYSISSEAACDRLTITLDGNPICTAISGETASYTYDVVLSKGKHTITATYSKDGSVDKYNDRGTLTLPEIKY